MNDPRSSGREERFTIRVSVESGVGGTLELPDLGRERVGYGPSDVQDQVVEGPPEGRVCEVSKSRQESQCRVEPTVVGAHELADHQLSGRPLPPR